MSVQTFGQYFDVDGHAKSLNQFRKAHEENSQGILNHAEGRPVDAPRPEYDPDHSDNQWPCMVHSPIKGELTVGKNLKGLAGRERNDVAKENQKALEAALDAGYRREPYPKPQIAVYDAAVEKADALKREQEMRAQIIVMQDLVNKLVAQKQG